MPQASHIFLYYEQHWWFQCRSSAFNKCFKSNQDTENPRSRKIKLQIKSKKKKKKMEPDSSSSAQWKDMRQQAQIAIQEILLKHEERYYLFWGWSNMGTGCPERLWSCHPWRYPKPAWTQLWATCPIWPHFWARVWTISGDPLQPQLFCDPVINCSCLKPKLSIFWGKLKKTWFFKLSMYVMYAYKTVAVTCLQNTYARTQHRLSSVTLDTKYMQNHKSWGMFRGVRRLLENMHLTFTSPLPPPLPFHPLPSPQCMLLVAQVYVDGTIFYGTFYQNQPIAF